MYRQYPYNSDTHPGISNNSFNILGLHYITILNENEVEVSSSFWHHTPGGPCMIQFNFHNIPAGRNYICLCMVDTEFHNRLYMKDDDRHYLIRATREVNKYGLVGMILQFIPRTHRAKPNGTDCGLQEYLRFSSWLQDIFQRKNPRLCIIYQQIRIQKKWTV